MKKQVVLYHANCYDGFGAAWAAWARLGESADYLPVLYGNPPPDLLECEVLYILDFSYEPGELADLIEKVPHITLLDHHKTAQATLAGIGHSVDLENLKNPQPGLFVQFDMKESGASLAYDYFFNNPTHNMIHRPAMINYLKDRDLWVFALAKSQEINVAVRSYPFDFKVWNRDLMAPESHMRLMAEGTTILKHQQQMVSEMCKQAQRLSVGGYIAPVVNATVYFSEVGDLLCQQFPDAPFAAYYLDRADGKRQWGLRSRGEFDVSEVAKLYGGGGHKNAAGFTTML